MNTVNGSKGSQWSIGFGRALLLGLSLDDFGDRHDLKANEAREMVFQKESRRFLQPFFKACSLVQQEGRVRTGCVFLVEVRDWQEDTRSNER